MKIFAIILKFKVSKVFCVLSGNSDFSSVLGEDY